MKTWVFALLLLALACDSREAACKEGIKAQLRDPESARFGKVSQSKPDRMEIEVNAKNGFGGYTGDKTWQCHFYSDGKFMMASQFVLP